MSLLTVNISTCSERIANISLPPPNPLVVYNIIWQPLEAEVKFGTNALVLRDDVHVVKDDGAGLCRSRNIAIQHVATPYFMIMDDDVTLYIDRVILVLSFMRDNQVDVASVLHEFYSGGIKGCSKKSFRHGMLSSARVSSINILCNTKSIREAGVQFDEQFGLGSTYPSGEEYIFITDSIKRGLLVAHYPVVCAVHPDITSGADFTSNKKVVVAKRKMLQRIFGYRSFLWILLFWVKKAPHAIARGNFLLFSRYLLLPSSESCGSAKSSSMSRLN